MNHNATFAIVAVVTAMTLTAVAFAIPQQALAYRHHNNHNNNNNHKNSIKVDQQVNQQNSCTGESVLPPMMQPADITGNGTPTDGGSVSGTVCLNSGDNSVDIHK
ncbi:MAG: hypothetical protein WAZ77_01185 [Candidatus Nitrosopolaris sp.]|jgi:hypothetical protein